MGNRPVNQFTQLRVAAVQAAPVPFDTDATITKLEGLVAEAAGNGAQLVAFGETFVSGFPVWNNVLPPREQHDFQVRLVESAIEVPGPETERLGAIARRHGVNLSVGVNEVSPVSVGTVWNANLMFNSDGMLVNHRRKLVATWSERLAWSHGDGHDLTPVDLDGARVAALICGENTNPLARFAVMAQGEEVHIATYPPAWPFDASSDRGDYDLTESIRLRSAAHSFEAKVYNIVAATSLDDAMIDLVAKGDPDIEKAFRAHPCASMILDPVGHPIAGPLVEDEGILYADIDTRTRIVPKQAHDVVGTYNRMDIFRLEVNTERHRPIRTYDGGAASEENAQAPTPTDPTARRIVLGGAE
ncbi:carbon-nitrogen hydrolase family protein [Aeromicrobium phragmitis]|uniref:Carbon-nitrogen hydrolase family protein n=1 Tax=Aeromicrobium phragmitis TaxID=2478914 RepID=A0A3L8PHT2_9ACTN|nr:carbon-nitrogen hydrolase family protein [Aeromicrobium phragmitis]RLV54857.1 carbon-nitrogen hydrolase family protein [Aeromicrobium phragmitis]